MLPGEEVIVNPSLEVSHKDAFIILRGVNKTLTRADSGTLMNLTSEKAKKTEHR